MSDARDAAGSRDTVILVHGLWMSGLELSALRHRLNSEFGFEALSYSYRSITGTMADHVRGLRELAQAHGGAGQLHFVGHSLGGIVIFEMLEGTQDLPQGRAVLLGSPLQGSSAVEGIAKWPMGRALVGNAVRDQVLTRPVRKWDGRRDLGIIAGDLSVGVGRIFANLTSANDGTILVEETRIEGAKDHIVMPVSHTGMVFSAEVASEIASFLHDGKFARLQ